MKQSYHSQFGQDGAAGGAAARRHGRYDVAGLSLAVAGEHFRGPDLERIHRAAFRLKQTKRLDRQPAAPVHDLTESHYPETPKLLKWQSSIYRLIAPLG